MYFQTINSNSPVLHAQVIGIKRSHFVLWEIRVWNWFSSGLNLRECSHDECNRGYFWLSSLCIELAIPSPGKQCHYPNGIYTSGKWYTRFVTHLYSNLFFNPQPAQNFQGFHWDYYSLGKIANCLSSVRWGIIIYGGKLYYCHICHYEARLNYYPLRRIYTMNYMTRSGILKQAYIIKPLFKCYQSAICM